MDKLEIVEGEVWLERRGEKSLCVVIEAMDKTGAGYVLEKMSQQGLIPRDWNDGLDEVKGWRAFRNGEEL